MNSSKALNELKLNKWSFTKKTIIIKIVSLLNLFELRLYSFGDAISVVAGLAAVAIIVIQRRRGGQLEAASACWLSNARRGLVARMP